jgi:hypothetical protein
MVIPSGRLGQVLGIYPEDTVKGQYWDVGGIGMAGEKIRVAVTHGTERGLVDRVSIEEYGLGYQRRVAAVEAEQGDPFTQVTYAGTSERDAVVIVKSRNRRWRVLFIPL